MDLSNILSENCSHTGASFTNKNEVLKNIENRLPIVMPLLFILFFT